MYKLLIAEDEALERALLEDFVLRLFPEVSEIYLASNGIEALRLAQKKQPDIILLDISMPGLSGLDLMKILNENNFYGKVLFITAYDYFDYAKRALELGAAGYVLKPVDERELEENVHKCFVSLEKDREARMIREGIDSLCSYAERYLVHDLLGGIPHDTALTGAYSFPQEGIVRARLLVFHFWHLLSTSEENDVLTTVRNTIPGFLKALMSFERNELVILSSWPDDADAGYAEVAVWAFLQTSLNQLGPDFQPEWVSATPFFSSYSSVKTEYGKLLEGNRGKRDSVLRFEPVFDTWFYSKADQDARIKKAVWGIRDGQKSRLTGSFHSLFSQNRNSAEGLYLVLLSLRELDPGIDLMDVFLSVKPDNIQGSLDKWADDNLGVDDKSGNAVIEEALRVMREEYQSPGLSQTVIAERFGLNPAYFSRLFKKETGKKFITVIGEIRMSKAKELLDQGENVEEVSRLCGYSTKQYFQEAFRNRYGMSVSVYQGKAK